MVTVNGKKIKWREGMTVKDVLNNAGFSFYLITVTVNGNYVPPDDYETYEVPDEADIKAIHIHHGG
jgi:thiamine biosynthesis protein ThiS